jgi:hypothetical protein
MTTPHHKMELPHSPQPTMRRMLLSLKFYNCSSPLESIGVAPWCGFGHLVLIIGPEVREVSFFF